MPAKPNEEVALSEREAAMVLANSRDLRAKVNTDVKARDWDGLFNALARPLAEVLGAYPKGLELIDLWAAVKEHRSAVTKTRRGRKTRNEPMPSNYSLNDIAQVAMRAGANHGLPSSSLNHTWTGLEIFTPPEKWRI